MRILSVRGQNLASLPEFSVSFEEDPIAGSGIFAITGPTGSGKSTILDAVCLALYDALPRLSSAESGITIGREDQESERLKYNDVRSILRHGTGAASAEVDFVGQDGKKYSARWEVRRARGRASGRIQNQTLVLKDLESGSPIGDGKTDTLKEIERRVGLGFEQFRRAVLLAQGEFDAFVRADSRERAELLERITGTQIYTDISIAAFNRAKQEKQELEKLQAKAGEYTLFSDQERAQLEQQIESVTSEMKAGEERESNLQNAADWFLLHDKLEVAVGQARKQWEQAQSDFDAADEARKRVDLCRKGLSIRAEIEAAEQESVTASRLADDVVVLTAKRDDATNSRQVASEARFAAVRNAEMNSKAYDDIGPQLDLAKELDAKIEERSQNVTKAAQELELLACAAEVAKKDLGRATTKQRGFHNDVANIASWLESNKGVETLVVRFDGVSAQLGTIDAVSIEIASTSSNIAAQRQQLETALRKRNEAQTQISSLDRRLQQLDSDLSILEQEIRREDRRAIESQKDAAHSTALAINGAFSASSRWVDAATEAENEQNAKQDQIRLAEEAGARADELARTLLTAQGNLVEARRNLDLSNDTVSEHAERMRSKLIDGTPCPVCGSLEHPLHEISDVLRRRVEADTTRVAEIERQVQELTAGQAAAIAQKTAAAKAADGANTRAERACTKAEAAQIEWQRAVQNIGKVLPLTQLPIPAETQLTEEAPNAYAALGQQVSELEASLASRLQKLSEAEDRASKFRDQREKARTVRDEQNSAVEALSTQIVSQQTGIALGDQKLTSLKEKKQTCIAECDGVLKQVDSGWIERFQANSDEFRLFCSVIAENWRDKQDRLNSLQSALANLQNEISNLEAKMSEKDAAVVIGRHRHNDACTLLAQAQAERSKVIGGRPHTEVRTEYRVAKESAQLAADKSQQELHRADQALTAVQSQLTSLIEQASVARHRHQSTMKVRDERLAALCMSLEQAQQALSLGESWINAETARLRAIEDARTNCMAILQERTTSLSKHENTDRPSQNKEEVADGLTVCHSQIEMLKATLVQAHAAQQNDEQARRRVAELSAQIQSRSDEVALWASLNELIGSADGAKFRRFAQSLTFEQLIQCANVHLAELKPRYELQRAPATDYLGLQVIDHDMADEVRGVHSLSGGERFLVSLALALGLASMSSNQGVRVQSLFIDEGFGALDPTSLSLAISALEHLQAGGRTVGIISHVEELKERIPVKVEVTPDSNGRSSVTVTVG